MKTFIEIDAHAESRRLHGWQLKLIDESDRPLPAGDGGSAVAVNAGESDVTIRYYEGRTWLYKVWQSGRVPGRWHLYAPSTNSVHVISSDQARLLLSGPWEGAGLQAIWPSADIAEELARLARLVEPLDERHWQFPALPAGSPSDGPPRVRVLMLNPTEQCNIRCTYCYYGGAYPGTRPHQTASPQQKMVEAAIDLFVTGDDRMSSAHRAVYFFGGEPLMAFDQLKESVRTLKRKLAESGSDMGNLLIQVNTNGMLLNEEIVEFLVEHDIYLNISVDGPNHDRYRIDRRGQGTLAKVTEKVDWLAGNWPQYFSRRVALICVLSQPLDAAALYRFFATWPAACQALAWDFDLLLPGGEQSYSEFEQIFKQQRRIWDLFVAAHKLPYAERESSGTFHFAFSCGFLHRSFSRMLNAEPRSGAQLHHLLGVQLVPGSEFLVLGSDGTLYSSYEFQSPAFRVGHTSTGIEPGAGLAQLGMFRDAIQAGSCKTCWAAPVCTVAVPEAPFRAGDTADDIAAKVVSKRARCISERENLLQALHARTDIAELFGDAALDGHRSDWDLQSKGASRVDYFYS